VESFTKDYIAEIKDDDNTNMSTRYIRITTYDEVFPKNEFADVGFP